MKRSVLVLLLLAGACSSSRDVPMEGAPPPKKEASAAPPGETIRIQPGSRRAAIFAWHPRFPRDLPPAWAIREADYVRTDDFANAWKIAYVASGFELRIAAAEYGSREGAIATVAEARRAIEARGKATPLDAPGERVVAGVIDGNAVAALQTGRYLFTFGVPGASEVGGETVRRFVEACFREPEGEK